MTLGLFNLLDEITANIGNGLYHPRNNLFNHVPNQAGHGNGGALTDADRATNGILALINWNNTYQAGG